MALTDEDKAEIAKMIGTSLTGEEAAKAIGKQLEGHLPRALEGLKLDAKIAEAVKAAIPEPKPEPDPKPGDTPKPGDNAPSFAETPEYKRMKAEMDEYRKQMERARADVEKAEAARKATALQSGVRDALLTAGADAKRIPVAMNHLAASGAIKLDDKGAPCFVVRDTYGEQLVPAGDHAAKWLGTDEGKMFVAPSPANGTGDKTGGSGGSGGNGAVTAESVIENALAALF